MLRTHTSAHEVETFKRGVKKWLLTADVYRRDEIDSSHYPVFHQMEGANVVEREDLHDMIKENEIMAKRLDEANIVIEDPTREITVANPIQPEHSEEEAKIIATHLKASLNSLVLTLFGRLRKSGSEPLQVRWIEATFPWTSPSYEVEVLFEGKWLEILGCGVVKQDTLNRSGTFVHDFHPTRAISSWLTGQ
jgi:phenylalanyl-tRNA synthetase alpha chain